MQIGERLRNFRKSQQMTLAQVSKKTGLSLSFISDIERGRTMPSVETCQRFCNCYATTISLMFKNVRVSAPNTRLQADGACAHQWHALEYNQELLLCDVCGDFRPAAKA